MAPIFQPIYSPHSYSAVITVYNKSDLPVIVEAITLNKEGSRNIFQSNKNKWWQIKFSFKECLIKTYGEAVISQKQGDGCQSWEELKILLSLTHNVPKKPKIMCEESNHLQQEWGTKAKWVFPVSVTFDTRQSGNFSYLTSYYRIILGQQLFYYYAFYLFYNFITHSIQSQTIHWSISFVLKRILHQKIISDRLFPEIHIFCPFKLYSSCNFHTHLRYTSLSPVPLFTSKSHGRNKDRNKIIRMPSHLVLSAA